MFNIGFSELILILLVALLFVGPKDLPKIGAYLGRTVRTIRGFVSELKDEIGLGEMEKEYRETVSDLKSTIHKTDFTEEFRQVEQEKHSPTSDTGSDE